MASTPIPDNDPWTDLVFHGLAHLDVSPQDASRLHDERYVGYVAARLPEPDHPHRTLTTDAATLATLYDASPGAHRLHGFTHLHPDVDGFLRSVSNLQPPEAFGSPPLPEALVELYRIALWGEVQAGFLEYRRSHLAPRYRSEAPRVAAELERLTPEIPALRQATWRLCHPLRHAGRLLWADDKPQVVMGVPDEELEVTLPRVVVQGVHECLLGVVLQSDAASHQDRAASPRAGAPGHRQHLVPELMALCLDAQALAESHLGAAFRAWLQRFYPNGVVDLLREINAGAVEPEGAPPEGDAGDVEALVAWLQAGGPVPAGKRACYGDAARRALARSRP